MNSSSYYAGIASGFVSTSVSVQCCTYICAVKWPYTGTFVFRIRPMCLVMNICVAELVTFLFVN